ncbi:MAG TPA: NfeD family protein [Bacillota bacterium]|nr:NfeD family protein [Bacillota bacterium]
MPAKNAWLIFRAIVLSALLLAASSAVQPAPADGGDGLVYLVRVQGTIDRGLSRTVERAARRAREDGADLLVVEINSVGGRVDAALEMRDAITGSPVPTLTLVEDRAWSAAALIALAGDRLIMQPGSSIGAAQPSPAEEKAIAAVRAEFEATAELHGRDPQLAAAMVDADIAIPGVVEQGKLLTLTAGRALELGLIDGTAADLEQALADAGHEAAQIVIIGVTPGERLARLVTEPTIAGLLLSFGVLGITVEFWTPGFGLPGAAGLACLALFFGGHLLAGVGGWEAAALFLLGLGLLAAEVFLPGFGVFGLGGLAALAGGVYLFTGGGPEAITAMATAVVITLAGTALVLRFAARRGLLHRLTLPARQGKEEGFSSHEEESDLTGQTGIAVTPFRPAGILEVGGRRVDAISEGGFVSAGAPLQVLRVEGGRIIVREVKQRR